jgi:hypothetical protein
MGSSSSSGGCWPFGKGFGASPAILNSAKIELMLKRPEKFPNVWIVLVSGGAMVAGLPVVRPPRAVPLPDKNILIVIKLLVFRLAWPVEPQTDRTVEPSCHGGVSDHVYNLE